MPGGVVRVWLLGSFRVSVGPRTIEQNRWRRRKAAALIKLLALAPGHRLHRERVMDLLWPQLATEVATNNLHRTLHVARRVLGPDPTAASRYLRFGDELLQLCPNTALWVDVEAFESAADAARGARKPAAYQAAIALYAGELLPEDRYQDWTESRRDALRETYLVLLVEMAGLYEERKELEPAIRALDGVVALEPTREEVHYDLMRLHAMAGQHHKAILRYEQLQKALSRELDSEPAARIKRLYREIRGGRFPTTDASAGSPGYPGPPLHNLPVAQSSFVGREREKLEVKRALSMTGLLTLTGAGGCGKTRLALEVASDLAGAYPDGAWLVELAPLSEEALAPNAVAEALGVREQPGRAIVETLVDYIRSRRMLLILDNCEHLIEACAHLVDRLSSSCEHLRILATSREALGVAGEANWSVPSLSVPDTDHVPAAQSLARYEAVQLFLERARSRLATFELTPENAPAVANICWRLDGIPLAIELATARMGALAVQQVAERLEDSLGFLTTGSRTAAPRQQTLKATLAWSYDLLNEQEQRLFGRLSVFAGGWTLEAAEAVGSADSIERNGRVSKPPVLDLLSKLVDKSLVAAEASGMPRYRMLEPVRQYAIEKLENAGEKPGVPPETERFRERHARYYLRLVEAAQPELIGAGQVAWLERLTTEHANLRAALGWFLNEEGAQESARMGLRLAAALGRFWSNRGSAEGREWLEKGLARSGAAPASLRAKALNEAGFIATYHVDPRAITMLEEALALFKELGDQLGQAISLNYLAHTMGILANLGRITTLREEAEALLEEPPQDRRAAAHLHLALGMMATTAQDSEQAVVRLEEALALFREAGDLRTSGMCLTVMGIAALGRGDAGRAARAYEDALRLVRQLKDNMGTFFGLTGAAGVAVLRGQQARAARLFGAAEALRNVIGYPARPLKQIHYDYPKYRATARAKLGETAFEAAFHEGENMTPEQAVEYALSADEPAAAPVPEESPPSLSRRQREVALLIAQGLTNRRIASELAISERTVTTHVARILNKLGATSRTQVAARVAEQRLLPEEGSN